MNSAPMGKVPWPVKHFPGGCTTIPSYPDPQFCKFYTEIESFPLVFERFDTFLENSGKKNQINLMKLYCYLKFVMGQSVLELMLTVRLSSLYKYLTMILNPWGNTGLRSSGCFPIFTPISLFDLGRTN